MSCVNVNVLLSMNVFYHTDNKDSFLSRETAGKFSIYLKHIDSPPGDS